MAEPTVQVPVSLIELAAAQLEAAGAIVAPSRLRALLSQLTPTAAPPSIADMGPGTTFTRDDYEGEVWTVRRDRRDGKLFVVSNENREQMLDEIDPSTIRDVTPPAVTS